MILVLIFFLLPSCAGVRQEEYDKVSSDLAEAQAQIQSLQAGLAEGQAQIQSLQTDLAEAQAQIQSLQADLAEAQAQIQSLQADLAEAQAQIQSLQADPNFKITADSTAHTDYGLSYPITYKFSIPATTTNLTVYEKKALSGSWTRLPTKTSNDFFNGIDAVRFDYSGDFAYISVAFSPDSDDIFLLFKDSNADLTTGVSFIEITDYYDNRKAACVITSDDWHSDNDTNIDAVDACQSRQIWISPGLKTAVLSSTAWTEIQKEIDQGYVEIVSHSRTHPRLPYGDYDSEIGGSKQDIIDGLNLPALNKKGAIEYVYAWTAPYGESDATLRSRLGAYEYLEDTAGHLSENYGSFPSWNGTDGLYNAWNRWASAEDKTEAEMNAQWDIDYAAGNIYHLGMHPGKLTWTPGSKILNHLDYIKGKKDVWYVGMGHLFVYHYVKERSKVTLEKHSNSSSWTESASHGIGAFEAFAGVFSIALFLVTFTRKMTR